MHAVCTVRHSGVCTGARQGSVYGNEAEGIPGDLTGAGSGDHHFDEPTNGLDILTAKVVTDFLLDLKEQGKTIIISTHIFSLVEKICDRVGIIINGRMAACEDLRTLCGDKSLEDRFFEIYEAVNGEDENHDK